MPSDYRYDPFNNIAEPVAITGETHIIPSNSPYTIRLAEVPVKESPSTVSLTIGGVASVEVAAAPAAGEFRCDYTTGADQDENWNTGLIQFNAADAGKTVVAAYNGMGTLASAEYRGHQLFTASGTFPVPKGVNKVYVSGCGGGGGGGGGKGDTTDSDGSGGGGGGGACAVKTPLTVTPGQTYTITIGAAGSAGAATPTAGGAGGTTSFGALLSLSGGGGGGAGNLADGAGGSAGNAYASAGGEVCRIGVLAFAMGGSSIFGAGSCNFTPNADSYYMTGTSGSGFGSGGSGGYAAGGNGCAGGAGKAGFMLIEW